MEVPDAETEVSLYSDGFTNSGHHCGWTEGTLQAQVDVLESILEVPSKDRWILRGARVQVMQDDQQICKEGVGTLEGGKEINKCGQRTVT